jgi:hypothetical protein
MTRPRRLSLNAGDTFNSWTLVAETTTSPTGARVWRVRCKCDRELDRDIGPIVRGKSKQCFSCGNTARFLKARAKREARLAALAVK